MQRADYLRNARNVFPDSKMLSRKVLHFRRTRGVKAAPHSNLNHLVRRPAVLLNSLLRTWRWMMFSLTLPTLRKDKRSAHKWKSFPSTLTWTPMLSTSGHMIGRQRYVVFSMATFSSQTSFRCIKLSLHTSTHPPLGTPFSIFSKPKCRENTKKTTDIALTNS